MSSRIVECPECESRSLTVVKEHDHKPISINIDVTFKCDECDNEFEGRILNKKSPYGRRINKKSGDNS